MSYCEAMEAAGAEILAFEQFGSYQGDWWAKVLYEDRTFWVHAYYGSCSGCDAFEAEFGYSEVEQCTDHRYNYPPPEHCKECDEAKIAYQMRLSEFGKSYLVGGDMTQKEAEESARGFRLVQPQSSVWPNCTVESATSSSTTIKPTPTNQFRKQRPLIA